MQYLAGREHEDINKLEKDLGLPRFFLVEILKEKDDWSFIVKLHALLESACNYLLVHYTGFNDLAGVFSKMQMGNKKLESTASFQL
jgi:hypothetical protein